MSMLVLLILLLNVLQVNSKQSSLRNSAYEAARLVVEKQYNIEDGNGGKASEEEIRAIVQKELSSEPLQWTVGTTRTSREASIIMFSTSCNLLRNTQSFSGIFLHKSIPSIISKICFTKSGLCVGLSPTFSSIFNPIPLPLIAFAATLVRHHISPTQRPANTSNSPMLCCPHGGQVFINQFHFLAASIGQYTLIASKPCNT